MRPLPIDPDRSDDLLALCDLGKEKIERVNVALTKNTTKFLKLEQFSSFISQVLDEDSAITLATWVAQLRRIADRRQRPVNVVLGALVEGLNEYGWAADDVTRFKIILPQLTTLITSPNVELVIKASDLYYLHTYHIHEARIVTDIRPVLSDDRKEIEAAIVKNLFILRYSDGSEQDRNLEIALSYEEMKQIRTEFDRAIAKTDLVKDIASTKLAVPALVYGADS